MAVNERSDPLNLKKANFYANNEWGIPLIKKQLVSPYAIPDLVPFKISKDYNSFCHFYIEDYEFERVWTTPDKYVDVIRRFKGAISPDFSLYTNWPKAVNLWQLFRSHWLGAYWQLLGITVIPNVTWTDEESFDWCFSGIEKGSTVCVSTVGSALNIPHERKGFMLGFNAMLDIVKPEKVMAHGTPNKALGDNVVWYDNYFYERFRKLKKDKEIKS